MLPNILEKLQLKDEKNLLIQGLPSSVEKQFAKITFAKNMTPLLRSRKVDFALVFVVNEVQLANIIADIAPAMHTKAKLWVAYPKLASKIATTLNRDCSWKCLKAAGYESVDEVTLDHVWTAMQFLKQSSGLIEIEDSLELEEVVIEETLITKNGSTNKFASTAKSVKTTRTSVKKQTAKSY